MRPALMLPLCTVFAVASLHCVWLNALKKLARNSIRPVSFGMLILVLLASEMFQLLIPGCVITPKLELPQVANAGCTKQAVLNHWKRVRPPGTSLASQIRLGMVP